MDLTAYFTENHPRIQFMTEVELNFSTAVWDDNPTEEEMNKRLQQIANADKRHEQWERRTYERLKLKYKALEFPS